MKIRTLARGLTKPVIERTFAWISRFGRLVTRHERGRAIYHAFTTLARCLICFDKLQGRLRKALQGKMAFGQPTRPQRARYW